MPTNKTRQSNILGNAARRHVSSERIGMVRNLRTGEVYLTSSLFEREVDGEKFIGVFKNQNQLDRKDPNWMRRDLFVKHKV